MQPLGHIAQSIAWLLDVVVSSADWIVDPIPVRSHVWLVITADSVDEPFSTPQAAPSKKTVWQYPFRLVVTVPDIAIAYVYISMCTYDLSHAVQSLARCRVPLGTMPRGSAKMIRFPLLDRDGHALCQMRFCATISRYRPPINPQPFEQNSQGPAGQRPTV
jgi:hypothetical protein